MSFKIIHMISMELDKSCY